MDGREGETRMDRARDTLATGAGEIREKTLDAVSTVREKAQDAARFVRESEPDGQLRDRTRSSAERGLVRAGDAVSGAAPAIGRGAEYAAEKVGSALKFAARPVGAVLGPIAGVLGGWWNKAREEGVDLPSVEEQACRAHFTTLALDGMTFEDARSGYAIGYIAGCNPEYGGRAFEDVEPDLRHGFSDELAEYDAIREFARFGYGRGTGTEAPGGQPGA
jgi:hypothetical protein